MMRSYQQSTTLLQSLHPSRKSILTRMYSTYVMYGGWFVLQLHVCNYTPFEKIIYVQDLKFIYVVCLDKEKIRDLIHCLL